MKYGLHGYLFIITILVNAMYLSSYTEFFLRKLLRVQRAPSHDLLSVGLRCCTTKKFSPKMYSY